MMMYESRNKSVVLTAAALVVVVAVSTTVLFVDAIDHAAVKEASEVCTVKLNSEKRACLFS